ncbi:mitochondrial large subunit ribosomal protein-domain-containing protein [Xylariaceae sp. FL0804]|nr:mitochondrial large subunit ribosomal protein-domain-containing protein [Xylariaceae sp. FL0804]
MLSRTLRPLASSPARLLLPLTRATLPYSARSYSLETEPTISAASATASASAPTPAEASTTPTSHNFLNSQFERVDVGSTQRPELSYFVGRNNLNNLSVYQHSERGGNRHYTLVKKAEGDLQALKQDLRAALNLKKEEISVNSTTRHVKILGHKRKEVLLFLHTTGF